MEVKYFGVVIVYQDIDSIKFKFYISLTTYIVNAVRSLNNQIGFIYTLDM